MKQKKEMSMEELRQMRDDDVATSYEDAMWLQGVFKQSRQERLENEQPERGNEVSES